MLAARVPNQLFSIALALGIGLLSSYEPGAAPTSDAPAPHVTSLRDPSGPRWGTVLVSRDACDVIERPSDEGGGVPACDLSFDIPTGRYLGENLAVPFVRLPDGRTVSASYSGGLVVAGDTHHPALRLGSKDVSDIVLSPTRDRIAYLEGGLVVRDTRSWQTGFSLPPKPNLHPFGFTDDGALWVVADGLLEKATPQGLSDGIAARDLSLAPDGSVIAIATQARIEVIDSLRHVIAAIDVPVPSGEELHDIAVASGGYRLAFEIGPTLYLLDLGPTGYVLDDTREAPYGRIAFDTTGDQLIARSGSYMTDDVPITGSSFVVLRRGYDRRAIGGSPSDELAIDDLNEWAATIAHGFEVHDRWPRPWIHLVAWTTRTGRAVELRVIEDPDCADSERVVRIVDEGGSLRIQATVAMGTTTSP